MPVVKPGGVAGMGLLGLERRGTRPVTELQIQCVVESVRKAEPERVMVPYTKHIGLRLSTRVAPDPGKPA